MRTVKWLLLFFDFLIFLFTTWGLFHLRLFGIGFSDLAGSIGFWIIALSFLNFQYIFGSYDFDEDFIGRSWLRKSSLSFLLTLSVTILVVYLGAKERAGLFGRGLLIGSLLGTLTVSTCVKYFLNTRWLKTLSKSKFLFLVSPEYYSYLKTDLLKNNFRPDCEFMTSTAASAVTSQQLQEIKDKNWNMIVVALKDQEISVELSSLLIEKRFSGVRVWDLIEFYERQWKKVPVYYLGPHWFILSKGFNLVGNLVLLRLKRVFDLSLALLLGVLSLPVMMLTALVIALDSDGPALFSQVRTGLDGRTFRLFKFRSMRIDAEKNGAQWASANDDRITRVGKFIRKTRLDELPQIWNVIKGEMSFIGPRPERPEFIHDLEKQLPFYQMRHLIRPGLTGWAQILYPYGASLEDAKEKLQFELFYIKNYSLMMDISILLKTVRVVLFRQGR